MKILCSIYKSRRKEGMYLYVEKKQELTRLPESLMNTFGQPEHVFDLLLHPERPLVRADVNEVMDKIKEQGFYLQMPPSDNELQYLGK